jgi:hypothetical protein
VLLTSIVDMVEKSRKNEANDKIDHQLLQNEQKGNEISVGCYIGEREKRKYG